MQNVYIRFPGTNSVRFLDGSVVYSPVNSKWIQRKQTGYTGPYVSGSNNDYIFTYEEYAGTMIEFLKQNPRPWTRSGDWLPLDPAFSYPELVPMAQTPLYNRLLDKLNDSTRGSLDLSVDIAEAGQTAKMLRVTDNVLDYTQTFVKRFGPIRVASSLWLSYMYGVKPLLSTIHGLAEESIRVVWNKTRRHRVRVHDTVYVSRIVAKVDFTGGNLTLDLRKKNPVQRSMSCGITVREFENDMSRFSSLNPVSIAWELLPYSFVVDWFVNVGGYLRSYETAALYGSRFISGNIAEYERMNFSDEAVLNNSERFRSYKIQVNTLLLRRNRLQSYPVPRLPQWDAKLGSSRMLSAASLLGNMLGKRS